MSDVQTDPYAGLRAPRQSGEQLIFPEPSQWPFEIAANRAAFSSGPCSFAGICLSQLRRLARVELLEMASKYSAGYADINGLPLSWDPAAPLILAGHQPELFHPGVWAKNFALDRVAKAVKGTAVNLVVDADLTRGSTLRIPSGNPQHPHFEPIAFDAPSGRIPYEEHCLQDEVLFVSFPARVSEHMFAFSGEQKPWLPTYWKSVVKLARVGQPIGQAFAQARHLHEQSLGLKNLEVPLSHISQSKAFALFVAGLLLEGERFAECYNHSLQHYRTTHHLRSTSHPAPDLLRGSQNLIETPLWCWTEKHPKRTPLFAAYAKGSVLLSGPGQETYPLPAANVEELAEKLQQLPSGWKLRPRALLTTLFARFVLSDFFLHGLGGAKYDVVTDDLMRGFFHAEPPKYGVVTATLRLPLNQEGWNPPSTGSAASQLWELQHHGERHPPFSGDEAWQEAVLNKQTLLANQPLAHVNKKEWTKQIRMANRRLFAFHSERANRLRKALERAQAQEREREVIMSREYAFCLFPQAMIEQMADQLNVFSPVDSASHDTAESEARRAFASPSTD